MNTEKDFYGYDIVANGDDKGRYATSEVAQLAYAEQLYSYISDASKDAQGFRTRFDHRGMTFADLLDVCDYWSEQVAIAIEEDRKMAEEAIDQFKNLIYRTIDLGAGDEETALRWLTQDEKFYHAQDVEHWVYNQGILFTDYGRELCDKLKTIISYEEIA